MTKKVGIVSAVFLGLVLLCCCGGLFASKQIIGRIRDVQVKDEAFVKTALTETAKNWNEADFAKYADDSFNQPDKRDETRKLFATLKEKLGPLVSLGSVTLKQTNGFKSTTEGSNNGLFLTFDVKAKFQKRSGVFEVTVRNTKGKEKIYAISLNPAAREEPSNNMAKI